MNRQDIYSKIDHTLLKQTASWEEIQKLCDEAIAYRTASVCIPPCYVKKAKGYTGNRMKICTVVGFPNGYSTTAVKAFETKDALDNGADEIDMVISIGDLKAGRTDRVREEICALKTVCGSRILMPAPTISRPRPVSPLPGQPSTMWRSLPAMWDRMSGSRRPEAFPPLTTPSVLLSWEPTAWGPAASSVWPKTNGFSGKTNAQKQIPPKNRLPQNRFLQTSSR